jgi:hypothetical protein
MTAAPDPRLPVTTAREVLQALVAQGQTEPLRAWVALDLDGTLFDNRLRTLAILRAFGMARSEAFVQFWQERFFTNAWQALDAVETGAVAFAHALLQAGLGVVYLTGRDRPGMLQGVMQALDGHGFPLATAQTQVVLKPDFRTTDLMFKREALTELIRNGPVVGLIDNEPGIVNMAMDEVRGLLGVRMCRPAAPDPPPLVDGALQIASFVL